MNLELDELFEKLMRSQEDIVTASGVANKVTVVSLAGACVLFIFHEGVRTSLPHRYHRRASRRMQCIGGL